jgi:hypothetical protein
MIGHGMRPRVELVDEKPNRINTNFTAVGFHALSQAPPQLLSANQPFNPEQSNTALMITTDEQLALQNSRCKTRVAKYVQTCAKIASQLQILRKQKLLT